MKARSLAHQVQLSRGGVVRIEPVTPSRPVKARIANARASAKAGFGHKQPLAACLDAGLNLNWRTYGRGFEPGSCRVDMNMLLLSQHEWRIKRTKRYRNPVSKLTVGPGPKQSRTADHAETAYYG